MVATMKIPFPVSSSLWYHIDITRRPSVSITKSKKKSELLFRLPEHDSEARVSRETLALLAARRGTNETEVMHYALKRLADEILPRYESDDGPITDEQLAVLKELAQLPPLGEACSSLFEDWCSGGSSRSLAIWFGATFPKTIACSPVPSQDLCWRSLSVAGFDR
jgi:hypothetical protein